MMGKSKKTEPKLFYHGVSLERRIPKDHPLRKIKELIDFDFIRPQVADLYGINGNESVDPVVILKLMFLLFYENINSERVLMRKLPLQLDWLWFCDYDIDEETPDHSVLSKARKRWGTEVFQAFFMNILEQCIAAGLVDGETIHMDSSTISANADFYRVRPQLRKITEELNDKLDGDDHEKLENRVSPVDPDARVLRKDGKSTFGYKDHRVIDDKHGIITTTITTPANVNDDKLLIEGIISHQFKTVTQVKQVVADKGYGTSDNYKYLQENDITPCIPHPRHKLSQDDEFTVDKFVYNSENDCCTCPAGEKLQRKSTNKANGTTQYRAERKTCEKCRYFTGCVVSKKKGRQVQLNPVAEYYRWADGCLTKHKRRRLMGRRKYKAEGSFADGANNHGFKHSRWRGLVKVEIQNLMIAAIQNLRKLMRYGYDRDRVNTGAGTLTAAYQAIFTVWYILFSKFSKSHGILIYQRANHI